MGKINLFAGIVLYNPDQQAIRNVNNLLCSPYFNKVIVFDNSNKNNKLLLDEKDSLVYLSELENKGVAYALKKIMDYSILNAATYTLTLDQDSIFPFEKMEEIEKKLIDLNTPENAIIALNYNNKFSSQNGVLNVKQIITSGNFINVKNYNKIKGFNSELFIDYVDFDLDEQIFQNHMKIKILTEYSLKQKIGNPIYKKILFLRVKSMNHSPIRYYYRYRNEKYLFKRNRKFYFINHVKESINILLMLMFEKNRREKFKMIKIGKKDANIKLGKFEER